MCKKIHSTNSGVYSLFSFPVVFLFFNLFLSMFIFSIFRFMLNLTCCILSCFQMQPLIVRFS